jgi:hypothetical protein
LVEAESNGVDEAVLLAKASEEVCEAMDEERELQMEMAAGTMRGGGSDSESDPGESARTRQESDKEVDFMSPLPLSHHTFPSHPHFLSFALQPIRVHPIALAYGIPRFAEVATSDATGKPLPPEPVPSTEQKRIQSPDRYRSLSCDRDRHRD